MSVAASPGACVAPLPQPSQVVTAASLGQGAVSLAVRSTARGADLVPPLKAGSYFVSVVYGDGANTKSAVSAGKFVMAVVDAQAPQAAIKPGIAVDERGFICAVAAAARATSACLNVATTGATSVVSLADNCGVTGLTRSYTCSGTCPSRLPTRTATKICVPVSASVDRVETVYTMTVADKGGRTTTLSIPIAAYHSTKRPAGVTCYSA